MLAASLWAGTMNVTRGLDRGVRRSPGGCAARVDGIPASASGPSAVATDAWRSVIGLGNPFPCGTDSSICAGRDHARGRPGVRRPGLGLGRATRGRVLLLHGRRREGLVVDREVVDRRLGGIA